VPSIDVRSYRMLDESGEDLSGRGIDSFLVRDVGRVRDVLGRSRQDNGAEERQVFATVEEPVEADTTMALPGRHRGPRDRYYCSLVGDRQGVGLITSESDPEGPKQNVLM
jgi:hypothetical protein